MSLSLTDNTGVVGEIATNLGYMDMMNAAEDSNFSDLNYFFENGYTRKPDKVAGQAVQLARSIDKDDVKSTLINLAKLLHKANGKAVVV